MRVYLQCFLEYDRQLNEDAAADPEHIKIVEQNGIPSKTRIFPVKVGDKHFKLPEALSIKPHYTDQWKIGVHAVGEGKIIVRSGGKTLKPYFTGTTKSGLRVSRYSGLSGDLTLTFVREHPDGNAEVVSMSPIVVRNYRGRTSYYIDPRLRVLGSPGEVLSLLSDGEEDWEKAYEEYRRQNPENPNSTRKPRKLSLEEWMEEGMGMAAEDEDAEADEPAETK